MEHEHSPQAIGERLAVEPVSSYLRDWVYGGIDGAVTTFAVVAGVEGARLSPRVILVLGLANLIADGFSMAAGNYSGTRAEIEEHEHLRKIEERHIREVPEGEREELRAIYRRKGFRGSLLNRIVEVISSDRERWIRTMLTEEYGLPLGVRSPLLAAASTFMAFVVCGAVPLLPFVAGVGAPFAVSAVLTGLVFFAIGGARGQWSPAPRWKTGLGTLAVGGIAAALAYAVGYLLRGLVAG